MQVFRNDYTLLAPLTVRLSPGDSGFIVQNIKSAGIAAIFAYEHQTIS